MDTTALVAHKQNVGVLLFSKVRLFTDPAELVPTIAGHMVAAVGFVKTVVTAATGFDWYVVVTLLGDPNASEVRCRTLCILLARFILVPRRAACSTCYGLASCFATLPLDAIFCNIVEVSVRAVAVWTVNPIR